jgi:hypothetical protein
LSVVFRKRFLCKCGCKGWCSMYPIFAFLHWGFRALAEGTHPLDGVDGEPFGPGDRERSKRAGSAMPFRAACVYVKGDWSEMVGTFGFPSWHDGLRPCYDCNAYGTGMYDPLGHTIRTLRWPRNGADDYEAACCRCELPRLLSLLDKAAIIRAGLAYDKRTDGVGGLALRNPCPSLALIVGDRLEPSHGMPDVGAFFDMEVPESGLQVVFWRKGKQTLTKHRNPLFQRDVGMAPASSLTVDELHANHLGVMKAWCKVAIWALIVAGIYGGVGTGDENTQVAVLVLRHRLMAWYKETRSVNPGLTQLSDLTIKMIGSASDPKLNSKGAETWGLLLFLLSELKAHRGRSGATGERYLEAGLSLQRVVVIFKSCGPRVPDESRQDI